MEIIHLNKKPAPKSPLAVALGYFDGLHSGHQEVILNAVRYAKSHQMKSAVMTFSINPKLFLNRSSTPNLLTPMPEKVKLLKQLGVDQLMILPFDEKIAKMTPDDFIKKYLIDQSVAYVSTGFDFRFGRYGSGNSILLKNYKEMFSLSVLPKMEIEAKKIGTTQIKEFLSKGEVKKAMQMLGRPYSLTGTVIKGNQRGRTIGFPTANLQLEEEFVIPRKGVYAVNAHVKGKKYQGMCNIGHNPTFNYTDKVSIEVNLLDFDEDIYGESIKLEFIKHLRAEKQFSNIDQLMKQLEIDRQATQSAFQLETKNT